VGLIVRAPRPLAPGIKLVRRVCKLSFGARESLFRALEGDMGSFSTLPFLRPGAVGTANFADLSVVGGPIDDIVDAIVVPVRLCGDARFIGD
jgi:hypothetical protein